MFEVGRVVNGLKEDGLCNEETKLAVTLFSKKKSVEELYFELRDMLAVLTDDIKHKELTFKKMEATHSYQHLRNLNAVVCDGEVIGEIGLVHPTVAKNIDKKAAIVYAEIDMELLAKCENASIKYKEPSRYPEMEIDLSFVSNTFEPIANAIKAQNSALIKGYKVVDTYRDENGKSITVRILFSHSERTLNGEEVKEVTDAIIADLAKESILLKQ